MPLAAGERLGPYEILGLLGSGGMGAVYRARDPRLGRDVAVKVVSTDAAPSAERLRRFEDEARAVAALSHPNVLAVFDVGTRGAEPYVVFELLEGETLRERLRRGPLPLRSAVETGVQVCRGLQAAHSRGILHRDLKPENLFLTSDGFVKILDFGLAKLTRGEGAEVGSERTQTVAGVVMGTPGYLSPEQARGQESDARSDIFALGAILYEALSGKRAFAGATAADTISAILHEDPPPLRTGSGPLPGPVESVVRRCLAKEPQERFHSAHDLALALEAALERPVAPAVEVGEKSVARVPYPGLSAFTESDAGHFFGRETEVEALWERIRSRRFLAVIGPSGAGKTSFVRAGVVASRPEGWAAIVSMPGAAPFRGLAEGLAGELAGDAESVRELLRFDEPAVAFDLVRRWRSRHGEGLLVVDQFEELFTLCPPESQAYFAAFLGRLASDAVVHVVLSMRDDFLMRCHEHEALAPVFSELTPLGPLTGEALRRALEEPAKADGFRFEEGLVGKMTAAVEGERGALPLLAFAVSRLWEKRDRERKLLTHEAYADVGGVAGALARHAEETLARIGTDRQGMVREVFRNLVTSQGTRAACDREELLSVFPDRRAAGEVLKHLVSGRLLTSWEMPVPEGASEAATHGAPPGRHRIEIVHESLLRSWPRLVRWRAQDEEGAVLRDQLKQAAHLWDEKGRTSDLLWTGTAFQEYELWRGRYPGTLTALEEDFARAMAERARRQKRRRRLAAGSVVAAALIVAVVTGGLWRRSEAAREQAKGEALRAEAGKLLVLAQTHLADDPTAALAYARGSLGLFDTPEARKLAVEILWRGPVARFLDVRRAEKELRLPDDASGTDLVAMSPDGRWLAAKSHNQPRVLLFPSDGGAPRVLPLPPDSLAGNVLEFGPRSDLLVTGGAGHTLKLWSLPDLREIRSVPLTGLSTWGALVRGAKLVISTQLTRKGDNVGQVLTLPDGEPRVVAEYQGEEPWSADPSGTQTLATRGRTVVVHSLDGTKRVRVLGRARGDLAGAAWSPRGDLMASTDGSGETRVWSTLEGAAQPVRVLEGPRFDAMPGTLFDPSGRRVSQSGPNGSNSLWDLEGFPDAQALAFGRPGPSSQQALAYDPSGRWLARGDLARTTIEFWPVSGPWRRVLPRHGVAYALAFTPDGKWLATCPADEPVGLWPLEAREGPARSLGERCLLLAIDPTGRQILVGTLGAGVALYPFKGGAPRRLTEVCAKWYCVAFDPSGRRAVGVPGDGFASFQDPASRVLRVWDLPSGKEQVYSLAHLTDAEWRGWRPEFAPDGRLFAAGQGGVRRLTLPSEAGGAVSSETVHASGFAEFDLSRDGRLLLVRATRSQRWEAPSDELLLYDLTANTSRRITTHGAAVQSGRLSPSGRLVVTGDDDGVVRVGPVTGEEPHLLIGHKGPVIRLAVSPDERWIASSSDEAVSIWPMPDVTKPPLHTLPHAELLAKLDALTNLRVVRDSTSATGWKLDVGPFAGWQDLPTW
jgi:WD40 repeat protein